MAVDVLFCLKIDGEGRYNKGWAETYRYVDDPDDLEDIEPDLINLGNLIMGMRAKNISCTEIRASRPGVFRDSHRVFSTASGNTTSGFEGKGRLTDYNSDQANACLQILLASNDLQKRHLFMAGLPDALLRTNGPGPDYVAVPTWSAAYEAWKALVTNGRWGFEARRPEDYANAVGILDWRLEDASPFQLIASISSLDDFASVGDDVQVRNVVAYNRGVAMPNGRWKVREKLPSGDEVGYVLRGAVGYDPDQIKEPGAIEPVTYETVVNRKVRIVGQTTRKRGVGPVRPRGRSSRRQRF